MTPLLVAVVVLSAAATSCATHDYYRDYRAAHPTWEPSFPRDVVAIDELLAIIHAPPAAPNTTAIVTHLVVLGLGTDPWETISLSEIRSGSFVPEPGRLYVVAARSQCLWSSMHHSRTGFERREARSFVWYLLRDDRLRAYDHTRFSRRCETEDLVKGSVQRVPGFEETLREHLDRGARRGSAHVYAARPPRAAPVGAGGGPAPYSPRSLSP
jgi:hypothetical protein